VADVGAGTGLFEPLLADAVGPQGEVWAVDISQPFLDRIAGFEIPRVHTLLCDEHDAKLPPASVDRIFICDTYHHFSHPQDTLASLRRALRPGGVLALLDFERVEGKSSPWVLKHVRAGKEVFRAEIEKAGFRYDREVPDLLEQNYLLLFRAP